MHTEAVKTDLRRHRRYVVDGGVLQVSWLDKRGNMKATQARAVDVSENGIALRLPEAVSLMLVRFRSNSLKVEGVGAVRHCHRAGNNYVVGLEFTEGLHWSAPDGDVQEPIQIRGTDLARNLS